MQSMLAAVVCLAFLATTMAMAQEQRKVTHEEREKFLHDFRRSALNSTPGDAMMLRILVQASRAKRGVEVGTADGYGAIYMGIAFERTGGHLVTLEIDPTMVQAARENIRKTGLEKTITVVEGDALKTIPQLEGEFDFVYLDARKADYLKYFQALSPKLSKNAVVVADNVISSANAMRDFLDFMKDNPDYDSLIIRASMEKNDGLLVAYRIR
jgi:predicted O-methyltransferase YrrM